ncbi:hypothetical protein HJD18_16040 [Thermoleophilia bacterium SCSIO 60948]|nr:hypothetical protein HJD18_16040 [Thermoleophilia bacterium SCSIO 60948]
MKRLTAATAAALLACLAGVLGSGSVAQGGMQPVCQEGDSAQFDVTETEGCYDVPAGVSAIQVEAVGGTGGAAAAPDGSADGSPGGAGAAMSGVLEVEPGQRLYVNVGGNGADGTDPNGPGDVLLGGYNGGGDASNSARGGSGGGATDIRTVPCGLDCFGSETLDSRLLVAAGGGGGGYDPDGEGRGNRGGAGGVPEAQGAPARGGDGAPVDNGSLRAQRRGTPIRGPGGRGGTESAGGDGGDGAGDDGGDGSLGRGGSGATGGGGGAGLYGGGGGTDYTNDVADPSRSGAGGGGGSSLIPVGFRSDPDETGLPVVVIDVLRPTVRTGRATKRRCRTATLTGVINAAGGSGRYDFSFGRVGRPLSKRTEPGKVDGTEDRRVSARIRGLKPGAAYRFRLNAFDSNGGVKTFKTKKRC